jgi:hypothetical protein
MYKALHHRTIRIGVITGQTKSPYGTNTKTQIFPVNLHWMGLLFSSSAVITGVQMGEMSKLD